MPWSTDDVKKHYGGASDHQKEIWVAAANNALQEYGEEGRAIRVANAAVNKSKSKPRGRSSSS